MSNAERRADCEERDHERCPHCDPGLLDELKCQAEGIQKQADYNAAHGKELDDARAAYNTARAAYNTARNEAESLVDKAREDLEELVDRVRCQLDGDAAECIDTAFGRVVERLNRCGHTRGCCCDEDCDYDDDVRDCDPDDVPGRLAVIKHRTKEAAECFWSLIGEHTVPSKKSEPSSEPAASTADGGTPVAGATPAASAGQAAGAATSTPATASTPATTSTPSTAGASTQASADTQLAALPARVKALQDEIAAISKAAADGSWDAAKLYAAVLVARRHLKDVWRGFANVNEYMECLCRALTCMIKGHAAIGELTRQAAVNECHRESRKARCEHLQDNTVDEVLAEYLRVCAEAGDDDDDHRRHHDDDDHRRHDDDDHHRRHDDDDDDHRRHDDDDHRRHDDDDHHRHHDDDHRRHDDDDDDHRRHDDERRGERPRRRRNPNGRFA